MFGAEIDPASPEARKLDDITTGARVIALGESGHGNHEPLAYRNRLIRYLVQHRGLTAIALESGLAEGRRVNAYVTGSPGDADVIVKANLTHGFGYLPENLELVRWLRLWNADPGHDVVHIYGIDLSGIQNAGPNAPRTSVVLTDVVAYLERTIAEQSASLRARLSPFLDRYNETDYPGLTSTETAELRRDLIDADHLFLRYRDRMTRSTGSDAYAWAAREAYDVRQLQDVFATWTNDPRELSKLMKLIELRDRGMAEHLLWALSREGHNARILLFQANGHVAAAPLVGSVMRLFPTQPPVTGVLLRRALGPRYRVIATVSSRGRPASDATIGSVDGAFAAAGRSPALLDLDDPGRSPWWSRVQSLSQDDARVDDAVPARAFDALVYFEHLTAVPPPPAAH